MMKMRIPWKELRRAKELEENAIMKHCQRHFLTDTKAIENTLLIIVEAR